MPRLQKDGSYQDFMIAMKIAMKTINECRRNLSDTISDNVQPVVVDTTTIIFSNLVDWEFHLNFHDYEWDGITYDNKNGIFTEYWNTPGKYTRIFSNKYTRIFSNSDFMLRIDSSNNITLQYRETNYSESYNFGYDVEKFSLRKFVENTMIQFI
jgi:hypothetical protein